MSKLTALRNLCVGGVSAAFFGGCATVGEPEVGQWKPARPGSAWTVVEHNTGSYGKDIQFEIRRGETVWQGQPAITYVNSVTGMTIIAELGEGRWMAIVGRDDKPVLTYDPPIGFPHPLKVGKEWATTHRVTMVATGRTSETLLACKVEAYEPVTVRAGTFNTFKILCKGPGYEDTYWSSADYGMFLKTNLRRLPDHPQGPGTQEREVVALNLAR